MIKALIVDDEQKARNVLRHHVEQNCPQISELREAESVDAALEVLGEFNPDIVFLDIEMPHRNGFDLLSAVGTPDFHVIFTTAYHHYAIRAIRFSALDYLMKPVDPEELVGAVQRHLEKRLETQERKKLFDNLADNMRKEDVSKFRIAVPGTDGVLFFSVSEILRFEAEGSYTHIVLTNRKPIVASRNMKHFEDMLEDFDFLRIHKSHLVNREHIRGITSDRDRVLLSDQSEVEISRRKKPEILALLGLR
jgi:two-component system, LytTR family, response regulator